MPRPELIGLTGIALIFLITVPFSFGSTSISSSISDSNTAFVDLNDTPNSYVGQAGKIVSVKATEDGLEFITNTGGGGGRTYTSGTPATIQVNNDSNTISQNFDGNFYSKLNPLTPWQDVNVANNISVQSSGFIWDSNTVLDGRYVLNSDFNEADANELYFKLNPTAAQTVTGGVASNFTGSIQALTNQPINIGNPAAARIDDISFYGGQFTAAPPVGQGALIFSANRGAFCITGTEICLDFNSTSNSVGLKEGFTNPAYYWKKGSRMTVMGLFRDGPATSLYTQWGASASEAIKNGDQLHYDYQDYRGIQPLVYNSIWGDTNVGWGHEDKISFYGTPKNGVNDRNSIGDENITGNQDINGALTITDGATIGLDLSIGTDFLANGNGSIGGGLQVGSSVDANNVNAALDVFIGNQLLVATGANKCFGSSTLVSGSVRVSTTCVAANSLIFLTPQNNSGTPGSVYTASRVAGTSFDINSTSATDTRLVAWAIVGV